MANTFHASAPAYGVFGRLRTALADFGTQWTAYWTFVGTLRELSNLTDRELADIGIARDNIVEVATEAAKTGSRPLR